jgi:hypothetical protein
MAQENSWYAQLRAAYKPEKVRLLLVGESAPASEGPNRRFFYSSPLTQADNLYRGVIEALYYEKPGSAGDSKENWLRRLQTDGVFLIDLVPFPVNKLTSGARSRALREAVPDCLARIGELRPEGVLVCHGPTFSALRGGLLQSGAPLLHDEPIPFPLGNYRGRFCEMVREVVGRSSLKMSSRQS